MGWVCIMTTYFNYFNLNSEKSYFIFQFGMADSSKYYSIHDPQPLLPARSVNQGAS